MHGFHLDPIMDFYNASSLLLSGILKGAGSTNMNLWELSPERRLLPFDPLILADFIIWHSYTITKLSFFFPSVFVRCWGFTDIIFHLLYLFLSVSSSCKSHANLLCSIPILVYVQLKQAFSQPHFKTNQKSKYYDHFQTWRLRRRVSPRLRPFLKFTPLFSALMVAPNSLFSSISCSFVYLASFVRSPVPSCQQSIALSSTLGFAFYVEPSWTPSPLFLPSSSRPSTSPPAFNAIAVTKRMF